MRKTYFSLSLLAILLLLRPEAGSGKDIRSRLPGFHQYKKENVSVYFQDSIKNNIKSDSLSKAHCDSLQDSLKAVDQFIDWYDHDYIPQLKSSAQKGKDTSEYAAALKALDSLKNEESKLKGSLSTCSQNMNGLGLGQNGLGANGLGQNGLGANGLGANGLGQNGLGANGLGANGLGQNGLGANGLGANGLGQNGLGQNGLGQNGLGQNGLGANGLGNNGAGNNGAGNNGAGNNGAGNNGAGNNGAGAMNNPGGNGNFNGNPVNGAGSDNTGANHPGFGSSYTYSGTNSPTLYISQQTGEFTTLSGQVTKTTDQFESGKVTLSTEGPIKYSVDPDDLTIGPNTTKTWKGKIMADVKQGPPPGFSTPGSISGTYDVKYKSGGVWDPVKGKWVVEGTMKDKSGMEKIDFTVVSVNVTFTSDSVFCAGQPFAMTAQGYPAGGAYNWFSNSPNVQVISFNGGTAIVNLTGNNGSVGVKYTVGKVSYTRTQAVYSVAGPPDFTLPTCVASGTATAGIVRFLGLVPNGTVITPAVLNTKPNSADDMIAVSVTACGKTITHTIRVIKLPDFTLPCVATDSTQTSKIITYNGPLPAGMTLTPQLLRVGSSAVVDVTISCCGLSRTHSIALLPDFSLPCCANNKDSLSKVITLKGPLPPGAVLAPQVLNTTGPVMESNVAVTLTLCNKTFTHTIHVVNSSQKLTQQVKTAPWVQMVKLAIEDATKNFDKGVALIKTAGSCKDKDNWNNTTNTGRVPQITFTHNMFKMCCADSCVKTGYEDKVEAKWGVGVECAIPLPIPLPVPLQGVVSASADFVLSGGVMDKCDGNKRFCASGTVQGSIGGGVGVGFGSWISANVQIVGSCNGSVNVCFDPFCASGSISLGQVKVCGTVNLTSFYSISGCWEIYSGVYTQTWGQCP